MHTPAVPFSSSSVQPVTRADIISHSRMLPAAPRVLAHIGELLNDLDADVSEIAREVRRDPGLTARVVRVSNSVMFGGAGDISDIEQALARVGFSNIVGLIGTAGIAQLAGEPLGTYGIDVDQFQECSLCHALAAETLAARVGEDPGAAYLAALLRGIGMVVLDRIARTSGMSGVKYDLAVGIPYSEFERQQFGITSAEATRMLLDEWGFPGSIVTAVDMHHLAVADALDHRLACVVNVAGELAAARGYGLPGDEPHWTAAPGKYGVLGITLEDWDELGRQVDHRFGPARDVLQAFAGAPR